MFRNSPVSGRTGMALGCELNRLSRFSGVSQGMSSYSSFSRSTDKITFLNPGTYFGKLPGTSYL